MSVVRLREVVKVKVVASQTVIDTTLKGTRD